MKESFCNNDIGLWWGIDSNRKASMYFLMTTGYEYRITI